ncbi:MAG: Uma2 family endonuclease [Armatimonadetes bacterium]|nr:Uma2 family endonuclease [Armatimonadota bacterium]
MSAPVAAELLTAEQFLQRDDDDRCELIDGEVVLMVAPNAAHGGLATRFASRLDTWAETTGLGRVVTESGFILARSPDTVRSPDVAFVSRERHAGPLPASFLELAPDLVVEVMSPSDRPAKTLQKVGEWIAAGTAIVLVVMPETRGIRPFGADGGVTTLGLGDTLVCDDILPDFALPLGDLFAVLD